MTAHECEPTAGDRKALSEILAAFATNGERNALAVLAEYREPFSSRIAELEKELTTPILVSVSRLADALADVRERLSESVRQSDSVIAALQAKIAKYEGRVKMSCVTCRDWNTQRNCDVCERYSHWQ